MDRPIEWSVGARLLLARLLALTEGEADLPVRDRRWLTITIERFARDQGGAQVTKGHVRDVVGALLGREEVERCTTTSATR